MDKIFIGSAKIIKTQFGELTKVSFSASDIDKLKENLNNGWVNLVVKEKKNKVEGKATHYLEVDTWESKPQSENKGGYKKPNDDKDLPF
jgi:hypothetical protein